ncbi:MAG TPA: hypothetical protein VFE58_15035 [Tepidisphaeraceae bacterium]|jgi:hypothetical protein|nr:hypothetical protein [Tepidisphaeraceae bacterium]
MRQVYIIFSEVGWAWFVIVIGAIWWRIRREKRARNRRGFEVVRKQDAK